MSLQHDTDGFLVRKTRWECLVWTMNWLICYADMEITRWMI